MLDVLRQAVASHGLVVALGVAAALNGARTHGETIYVASSDDFIVEYESDDLVDESETPLFVGASPHSTGERPTGWGLVGFPSPEVVSASASSVCCVETATRQGDGGPALDTGPAWRPPNTFEAQQIAEMEAEFHMNRLAESLCGMSDDVFAFDYFALDPSFDQSAAAPRPLMWPLLFVTMLAALRKLRARAKDELDSCSDHGRGDDPSLDMLRKAIDETNRIESLDCESYRDSPVAPVDYARALVLFHFGFGTMKSANQAMR